MLYRTPYGKLLVRHLRTSSSEPLSDSRKNLIPWNGIDTSGPEFDKPTLGNRCPFLINIRVWTVQGTKEGAITGSITRMNHIKPPSCHLPLFSNGSRIGGASKSFRNIANDTALPFG